MTWFSERSRIFGHHEKCKAVRFGLAEVDDVIEGLSQALAARSHGQMRNWMPVGFVDVPGFGNLSIGWDQWDWTSDNALLIRQQPRYGSSAAVAIRSEYVVPFVAWLLGKLVLKI